LVSSPIKQLAIVAIKITGVNLKIAEKASPLLKPEAGEMQATKYKIVEIKNKLPTASIIERLAALNPYISVIRSLNIYETGNIIDPPSKFAPQKSQIFVAAKLDAKTHKTKARVRKL
jgi:hypothetical protein